MSSAVSAKFSEYCSESTTDRCPRNTRCHFRPHMEKEGGYCENVVGAGASCGGKTDHPDICAPGFRCYNPNKFGELGICRKIAQKGQACDAEFNGNLVCELGYRCKPGRFWDDSSCEKSNYDLVKVGERCGGIFPNVIECEEGSECYFASNFEWGNCEVTTIRPWFAHP